MSAIQWTDRTWNPVRGCTRVSEGCRNCYAERMAARFSRSIDEIPGPCIGQESGPFHGFASMTKAGPRWTGRVELIPEKLDEPLRWRKPQRVFVNSMSDLFHEALPDQAIVAVFAIMALAPRHTFQILTKRPRRMRDVIAFYRPVSGPGPFSERVLRAVLERDDRIKGLPWPLPNVWLGVSVEDQATADERIPLLLQTPAAKRFISYEPALGPVDFGRYYLADPCGGRYPFPQLEEEHRTKWIDLLDLVIVGGESGPGARPFDVAWARSTMRQCQAAGDATGKRPAFFMKQMGSRPVIDRCRSCERWTPCTCVYREESPAPFRLEDRKGGDMAEWLGALEDLRVRELPA